MVGTASRGCMGSGPAQPGHRGKHMNSTNLQDAQNTGEDDSVRRLRDRKVSEKDARDVAEASRITDEQRPSFAKGIYLGDFDLSLIRPHPALPEEEIERSEKFLADLTSYCSTLDGQLIESTGVIPDDYLSGLAELGVFGIKIPREYGGLGLSLLYYGRALMILGTVHPSLGALVSADLSIGVPEPVKVFGSEEQRQEYLPRCAAGAITADRKSVV